MKLLDLRKISIGIQELQEAEINTLLAYKLSIIKNKIQPHEEAIVEAVYDFAFPLTDTLYNAAGE